MQVRIKEFNGPLDLLLQLIRREEMDIFDIDIHKITEQYLTFIKQNPVTDLNSAGDFIRMAALLIYIKSKSLFPSEPQEETEEDPQKRLALSLLKMSAVQDICRKLSQYPLLNRDVWKAGERESKAFDESIKTQPIIQLLRAYRRVFQQRPTRDGHRPSAVIEPLPFLTDCIRAIHPRLIKGSSLKMSSLIDTKDPGVLSYTVVTFLTLLELSRLGVVSLAQEEDFADIMVLVRKSLSDGDFQSLRETEINGAL